VLVARKGTQETKGTKGQERARKSLASFESLSSLSERDRSKFIPPHGGYQDLLSYQKALIVYDATLHFCNRFFSRFDRTREQMIQAARSGKQNILEGSEASATSKETEIKLTNTARASLKELLEDYRDFMRNRGIAEWPPDHPYALRLRQLNRTPDANYETFKKAIEHADPAICANVIAGLVKVTCYLLDRQIQRLEEDFLREGRLRERMTRARLAVRHKQSQQRHKRPK
jgi:four helix bundle suffix protein